MLGECSQVFAILICIVSQVFGVAVGQNTVARLLDMACTWPPLCKSHA